MAVADTFQTPLGLAALASLVVLLLLYLVGHRPAQVPLPTLQFLSTDPERAGRKPRLRRLRRSLLFVLQALALVLCALALSTPVVPVDTGAGTEHVLVVDTSASMAADDGGPRFERAVRMARGDAGTVSTVVLAGESPSVVADETDRAGATAALGTARRTDAPGDLASAITAATAAAGRGATVHVYSDFVDGADWRASVERARAAGHRVELHQVGGPVENVGIVDRTLGRTTATVTVRNFGTRAATRTVTLGDQSQSVALESGDLTTVTLDVPAGGGQVALTPRDAFPVDDVLPVGAPPTAASDVLLLTNDPGSYLRTALGLVETVDLRVERLPAPVSGEFDVVVFDAIDPERLLAGNLALARETLRDGGGVVVTAQRDIGRLGYGDLLPVDLGTVQAVGGETTVLTERLTEGLRFPAPEAALTATVREGRALVRAGGAPLVVTATRGPGRLLYTGYLDEASDFPFDADYPRFWQRAMDYAADRPDPSALNRRTGERLTFADPTTVGTPEGTLTASTVPLRRVGVYDLPARRVAVGLLSPTESAVSTTPLSASGDSVVVTPERTTAQRPLSLVPVVLGVALLVVLLEVAVLVYRGDL